MRTNLSASPRRGPRRGGKWRKSAMPENLSVPGDRFAAKWARPATGTFVVADIPVRRAGADKFVRLTPHGGADGSAKGATGPAADISVRLETRLHAGPGAEPMRICMNICGPPARDLNNCLFLLGKSVIPSLRPLPKSANSSQFEPETAGRLPARAGLKPFWAGFGHRRGGRWSRDGVAGADKSVRCHACLPPCLEGDQDIEGRARPRATSLRLEQLLLRKACHRSPACTEIVFSCKNRSPFNPV